MDSSFWFFVTIILLLVFIIFSSNDSSQNPIKHKEYEPDCSRYTEHYNRETGVLVAFRWGESRMEIDGEPCLSIVYDAATKEEIKRTDASGVFLK